METNRTKEILGVNKSTESVNTDTFVKLNIDSTEKLLPFNEINEIVNVGEKFNEERQNSKRYRIVSDIKPLISNCLFNLNNVPYNNLQTLAGFNELLFLDTSYPKNNNVSDPTDIVYSDSINQNLKEINGWFGYFDPDVSKASLCNFFDMEPTRKRFSFIPDIKPFSGSLTPVKNWELTITYPAETDKEHNLVKGGLLIVEAISVFQGTREMVAFGMPCRHNLLVGDTVRIIGTNGYNGDHKVVRLGLDNGDLIDYYFVIDLPPTGNIGNSSRIKRIFGGQESEYYFRKFKKINNSTGNMLSTNDYQIYNLSFSKTVFDDPIYQFVVNADVDINNLVDNLGRPLTEMFLTIIKTDSDGLFTKLDSGIETPLIPKLLESDSFIYLQTIPTINRIHNGGTTPFTSSIPLESQIKIDNRNIFYGDLVEFNKFEVLETVLADVNYRFNTLNRETQATIDYVYKLGTTDNKLRIDLGPRQEGYYYKPHYNIKIREISNYVEQGDDSTDEIPDYAINLGDGRYLWRDILDIGFNESSDLSLNYPFLNGCHYLYINNIFKIKRQDSFNTWGLYYSNFPSDIAGKIMTDKFTVKTEDNSC